MCCYGGDNMDQERIFVLHEFINEEAWNWFHHHVLHTNRDKQDWTFKEVLIGLYNRFMNMATMQEAQEAFRTAVYDAQTGVQTFYEELIGHAQNMAMYLDEFTIQEIFLDGIPAEMHCTLIEEDQEELVNDKEVPSEVKEPGDEDDAESIHINGDEYIMVDVYDNEYYTHEDDEEHLFALTEYQGDRRIKM
ncbi:hypothetical protein C0995_011505 [Termitomyces sp. Mi166|nr:hypothetical protein C0995_011505 [Termitomyces sp. Mi166\